MADWVENELGKLLTLNYGWGLPEKKRVAGEFPVYGSNGVVGYHNQALVNTPGIIVGRKGSGGRVHLSPTPFCPIDTTFYITQGDTCLDLGFLYYLLLHIDLQKLVTGVGVPGLNRELAYCEKTVHPVSKEEQIYIAHVLSTVQDTIEKQTQLITLTRELKSALMQKLFTEGLHGERQKGTETGLVPVSWVTTKIGNIAKLQSGGTPSRKNLKYWTAGTIPWVKTTEINFRVIDVTDEFITEEGLSNSAARILPKGTLLVAMYGQGITRGRVGILGLDAATNQACAAITPFDEKQVKTWFLFYYLQFHYNNLRELGHGANQRNLNLDLIKNFPLSYPPINVQRRIIDTLLVLDKQLTLSEQKRRSLEELFRTFLHLLMTGKIRVNDIELPSFS